GRDGITMPCPNAAAVLCVPARKRLFRFRAVLWRPWLLSGPPFLARDPHPPGRKTRLAEVIEGGTADVVVPAKLRERLRSAAAAAGRRAATAAAVPMPMPL